MRVLAHNDGPDLRGSERQLLHLACGLVSRGHEVMVSCRAECPLEHQLRRSSVPTTRVRPRGDLAVAHALEFRRLLTSSRPDVVLLTSWKRVFLGSWLARLARVPRVVVRLGIVRTMPPDGVAAWKLRRAFDRQVDALVVNSEDVRRAWLESAPWFPADRVTVIRNGIAAESGNPDALRRKLGVARGVRLLAAVAALEPRKGIDVLLRALTLLPPDVHLVVAGDGPEESALHQLSAALGLELRVHWLGHRSQVADVWAGSAALVVPTRSDSTPNALLEAMAAGVPVVMTAGNGAEEALGRVDGRASAGWIAPQEDAPGLAGAVAAALADAAERTARVEEARWRARHWFGVERMVDEYEGVLSGTAMT